MSLLEDDVFKNPCGTTLVYWIYGRLILCIHLTSVLWNTCSAVKDEYLM